MLDQRLSAVAVAVRPGSVAADIGTDHAYLPVWLVGSGVCPSAIAADVRPGPLNAARRHVYAAGLEDRISLRLGDGLSVLRPDEATDIVIAGMGGETIVSILAAADWPPDTGRRWILQPMSHGEDVRRYLTTHGHGICEEHLITDGHHLYPVMIAEYTGAAAAEDPLLWYGGAFSPEEGRPYRRMMARHLRQKALGFRAGGDGEQETWLLSLAAQLEAL